eukprot:CAMPEP_0185796446 /NCGR_PEP_ID=MMETSP1174-20130828/161086_1 /TAXON_ID=35687 /ORGANISM="Dictyocha speculum, Strain CCMP1381" /LENGTH=32 /DNA_ID= /DNA_START= /DNA_END= /DNA_ORIENTATION=
MTSRVHVPSGASSGWATTVRHGKSSAVSDAEP